MPAPPPVDLAAYRRRTEPNPEDLHQAGAAFAFAPYTFNDDGFGTIESGEVVVVTDHEALTGICMSREDALRFGAAVIQAAVGADEPEGA